MSDLISRRMMLDKMISRKSLFSTNQYEYMALSEADKARADEIDNCIADLRNAPDAEPERKWTSVTEALPWNDTNVLVTVRDDSGDTPWEHTSVGWRTPDGHYWVVDNEICYGVIAWMPLPEPYRGE